MCVLSVPLVGCSDVVLTWLCCTRWFLLLSLQMKPQWMTIQIKTIEQYFHVELFIILNTVVLIFTWGTTRDMVHAVQNVSNFNVARLTLWEKSPITWLCHVEFPVCNLQYFLKRIEKLLFFFNLPIFFNSLSWHWQLQLLYKHVC